ncbi:hypothetical protein D1007_56834 [Hordeum vulgare]|nr:hypothetical protein D1007_56834 [Hordeum vulgare]
MAGRPSESINWDGLGNEADEDASEMNYEYERVVPDHDEDMELPPRHMAKTTLWRRLKDGLFRRHTYAIKSTLTDENKVMFLAAVARPRFDGNGTMTFDGKLGIWPFTYQEPAKRKSKNRDVGTMVTKVLPAVTQNVVREYMINFLIPSIRARWHAAERGMPIYVQQDNAKTHIPLDDPEFVAAAQAEGWDIRLTCQPPNSPDLNILDLGSIDDIVIKVEHAFDEYPAERSNRIFLTLQSCMVEVLKQLGGNRYKVPHMRKADKERLGNLPITLQCTASIVKDAIESLPDV